MYVEDETYIACEQDYSDLEEKVDYVLDNFDELQPYLIEVYNPINLVKHTYNLFNNLDGVIAA